MGRSPIFFLTDYKHLPKLWAEWGCILFFNLLKAVRSHLQLILMMTGFRHIYSLPNLHQKPKQIQQMQKQNWNVDLTNAEDNM